VFSRSQAVLRTSKCWQELRAALPSPGTMHDSRQSLFSLPRPSPPSKMKESAAGCWCSCFSLREPSSVAKRQLQHNAREPSETEIVVPAGKSAHPAFKTLLVSVIEFMLSVGLYHLLAFKPVLSVQPCLSFPNESLVTSRSGPAGAHPSRAFPQVVFERQEMGTTAICFRMIPYDFYYGAVVAPGFHCISRHTFKLCNTATG